MSETVRVKQLERVIPASSGFEPGDNSEHPMRSLTEDIVRKEGAWTPKAAKFAGKVFDDLAPGWEEMFEGDRKRFAPVSDALERGGPINFDAAADIGAGTAVSTQFLQGYFDHVVGFDLSFEMLRRGSVDAERVQSDGAKLPLVDSSVDAVMLMNAFLFPAEVDRVLRPEGVVVWVSSVGPTTPIYLSAEEVADAMPGQWGGVWAEAGNGTWAVLRRTLTA